MQLIKCFFMGTTVQLFILVITDSAWDNDFPYRNGYYRPHKGWPNGFREKKKLYRSDNDCADDIELTCTIKWAVEKSANVEVKKCDLCIITRMGWSYARPE